MSTQIEHFQTLPFCIREVSTSLLPNVISNCNKIYLQRFRFLRALQFALLRCLQPWSLIWLSPELINQYICWDRPSYEGQLEQVMLLLWVQFYSSLRLMLLTYQNLKLVVFLSNSFFILFNFSDNRFQKPIGYLFESWLYWSLLR